MLDHSKLGFGPTGAAVNSHGLQPLALQIRPDGGLLRLVLQIRPDVDLLYLALQTSPNIAARTPRNRPRLTSKLSLMWELWRECRMLNCSNNSLAATASPPKWRSQPWWIATVRWCFAYAAVSSATITMPRTRSRPPSLSSRRKGTASGCEIQSHLGFIKSRAAPRGDSRH